MLPLLVSEGELPFANGDYIFVPDIREAVEKAVGQETQIAAYVVKDGELKEFALRIGELTPEERATILAGCLINHYRG